MLVRALAGSPRSAWCPQGSAVWEPASVSLCFRPKVRPCRVAQPRALGVSAHRGLSHPSALVRRVALNTDV